MVDREKIIIIPLDHHKAIGRDGSTVNSLNAKSPYVQTPGRPGKDHEDYCSPTRLLLMPMFLV